MICVQCAFSCLTSLSSSSSFFPTTPQPWSTLHLLEPAQHGPIYKPSVAPSSARYFESTILSITARSHGHLALSRCLHKIVQRASPACAWEVRTSHAYYSILAETDGAYNTEVIREKVQDGVTGETREMQYTQCKIVGNGSFGVVFQTKLAPNGEDAAIKRVLQDKRFKVSLGNHLTFKLLMEAESRIANHAHCPSPQHCRTQSVLLLEWRACKQESILLNRKTSSVTPLKVADACRRKKKSTSTLSLNSCQRPCTVPHVSSTK